MRERSRRSFSSGHSNRPSNEATGSLDHEAYLMQYVELSKRPRTMLGACFSGLV